MNSLTNTVKPRFLHRPSAVPVEQHASSAPLPSLLQEDAHAHSAPAPSVPEEEDVHALQDETTDLMAGFQLPLEMPEMYKTVASTIGPGMLAFNRSGAVLMKQVQEPMAAGKGTFHLQSLSSSSSSLPSISSIDDKLMELLEQCLVYLSSFEVLASITCFCVVCWLLHRCVLRRPRVCLALVGTWSSLFCIDLLIGRGPAACVKNIVHQSKEASQASRELAHCTVRFVAAWLSVLMPVVADVAAVLATTWQRLAPRQRLFVCSSVVVIYAMISAFRAICKHSAAISKIVFQASFLIAGPMLWFLSGHLSPLGLQWTLSIVLSGLPTLMSFHAACRGLAKQDTSIAWSFGILDIQFLTQEEWCELWIAFWALWPVLMMLRFATQRLPHALPDYQSNQILLPNELDRALIVFTLWIQFWQGGILLNHTIRFTLGGNGAMFSAPRALLKRWVPSLPSMPGINTAIQLKNVAFRKQSFGSTLQMAILLVVASILVVTWAFYHTLRLACEVLVLITVCVAAVDSANIVSQGSKDFYIKRVSFWVLLQVWRTFCQVPLLGSGLSLATPFAFSLFFVAGDHILAWLLIPLAARLWSLPKFLTNTLMSLAWTRPKSLDIRHEAEVKPDAQRLCAHKPKHLQILERTFFNIFVAPVTELFSVSNMRVALAVRSLLAEDKNAA